MRHMIESSITVAPHASANQQAQPAGFFHIQVCATSPTGSVALTRVFTEGDKPHHTNKHNRTATVFSLGIFDCKLRIVEKAAYSNNYSNKRSTIMDRI